MPLIPVPSLAAFHRPEAKPVDKGTPEQRTKQSMIDGDNPAPDHNAAVSRLLPPGGRGRKRNSKLLDRTTCPGPFTNGSEAPMPQEMITIPVAETTSGWPVQSSAAMTPTETPPTSNQPPVAVQQPPPQQSADQHAAEAACSIPVAEPHTLAASIPPAGQGVPTIVPPSQLRSAGACAAEWQTSKAQKQAPSASNVEPPTQPQPSMDPSGMAGCKESSQLPQSHLFAPASAADGSASGSQMQQHVGDTGVGLSQGIVLPAAPAQEKHADLKHARQRPEEAPSDVARRPETAPSKLQSIASSPVAPQPPTTAALVLAIKNQAGAASAMQQQPVSASHRDSTPQGDLFQPRQEHEIMPSMSSVPQSNQRAQEMQSGAHAAHPLIPQEAAQKQRQQRLDAAAENDFGRALMGPIFRDDISTDPIAMQMDDDVMGLDPDLATAWHSDPMDNTRRYVDQPGRSIVRTLQLCMLHLNVTMYRLMS